MNRNAYVGRNVEQLFKNSISDHPDVVKKIQDCFGIEGRFLKAISTGIHSEKADVKMEFADGHNIDANVKAYKLSTGYNQLTRTSVKNFCKKFNLDCGSLLGMLFVNKAARVSSMTFPTDKQDEIRKILEPITNEMVNWAFSYKSSREILVLYERQNSVMRIYSMKEVLKNIGTDFSFTEKGNIAIGKYVILQRKGGNGIHVKDIKKTDIIHPGNNVQLKLKMNHFVAGMTAFEMASYLI